MPCVSKPLLSEAPSNNGLFQLLASVTKPLTSRGHMRHIINLLKIISVIVLPYCYYIEICVDVIRRIT
jgi:hypothetical protein